MDKKTCTRCKEEKALKEFSKRKDRRIGYTSLCRSCVSKLGSDYKKTKKGVLRTIYGQQISHSKKRGHILPGYTSDEFVDKFINDIDFVELWENWRNNGFKKALKPSFDRINNQKPYSFSNIIITTWSENNKNGNISQQQGSLNTSISHKAVKQYSINGNFIQEFISVREAGRATKAYPQHISHACNGKRKTAGGFKWEFS
jgi:hypothetical protein